MGVKFFAKSKEICYKLNGDELEEKM